jgi:hypothetical protein
MTTSINTLPGETVVIVVQTLDGYGSRSDGYEVPTLDLILKPDNTQYSGLPATMTKISAGLYRSSIVIPSGVTATGTYIASCSWPHPSISYHQYEVFIIQVNLPFSNISVSPA